MGDNPSFPPQCWGFGEDHLLINCPHWNESGKHVHNTQGVENVGEVVRIIHRIYDTLEDHQSNHQSTMFKVEGNIIKQYISILIDPASTHNYTTPKVVEVCAFKKKQE